MIILFSVICVNFGEWSHERFASFIIIYVSWVIKVRRDLFTDRGKV